jgi:hypothetical protein
MCKTIQSAREYSSSRQCKLSVMCASYEVVKVRSFKGFGVCCVLHVWERCVCGCKCVHVCGTLRGKLR